MKLKQKKASRWKLFVLWITRALCASVLLATIDVWTANEYRCTFFSTNSWKMKDGGSTGHNGLFYSFSFWRKMDGSAYGPTIWFWFTPFVLDFAHQGVRVRAIWQE